MDLAELLRREGVRADDVDRAERHATKEGRPLSRVVVEQGLLNADVLADVIAREVGSVVVDVGQGELERETLALFSPAECRRHLFIPIAHDPSGQLLRVAFANPLDQATIDFVGETSGFSIQPLVAPVFELLAAIDRAFPRETAQEIAAESTEQIARGGPTTTPLHRIEHDLTIEQRHEALLLTLIEAGLITRQDYLNAVRRLLGR